MFPIRDTRNSQKFPAVNLAIIIATIYVFFLELTSPDLTQFIAGYALTPSKVDFFQFASLKPCVTSIFLHAGFLHIGSNMWFLWIFGDNVESKMGHLKYLAFYVFSGIVASFFQYLFIADSTLPMLGASGAIAGVLGAYLRLFPKNSVDTVVPIFGLPLIVAIPASFMLIYWFVTQAFNGVAAIFTQTASIGGIAYLAHAGGFASGFLFVNFFIW